MPSASNKYGIQKVMTIIIYISHALYALPMAACIGRVSQTPYIPWDKKCKSYGAASIEYLILYIKKTHDSK